MEDKNFIQQQFTHNAQRLLEWVSQLSNSQFEQALPGKWSVGQTLDHLNRSLKPVNQALLLPGFVFRILFGKPNRQPRTFVELVERYNQKLQAGGRASGRFIPPPTGRVVRTKTISTFQKEVDTIQRRMQSWNEQQLDHYLIPHPLLGKLTVREMLFFSAYHIDHHLAILKGRS